MGRVIIYNGSVDTLDVFAKELQKGFQENGWECLSFSEKHLQESLQRLSVFIQEPVDAFVTFNNYGLFLELVKGEIIWEALGIPCIDLLVDHPVHYKPLLEKAPKNTTILCVDRNHADYVKRFYPNIQKVMFMPHGGTVEAGDNPAWEERLIDVIYAGGIFLDVADYLSSVSLDSSGLDAVTFGEELLERMIGEPDIPYEIALEEHLRLYVNHISDNELNNYLRYFRFLEHYAVSHYREKAIKILADSGIHVTVYGNGWDKREIINNPNVHFGGVVSPEQILCEMKKSKVVLNSMPGFKSGSHERIFNGMLAGAVVLTDTSGYIEETFEKNELIAYNLKKQENIAKQVKDLLANSDKSKEMIQAGREKALTNRWQDRATYIIQDVID